VFREFLTEPVQLAAAGFLTARCAGKDKYFSVLDGVFRSQQEIFATGDMRGPLVRVAKSAGMTEEKFMACVSDEKALKALSARVEKFGKQDNITGTPTFIINGKKLDGEQSMASLDAAITAAKAAAK
jgi:protein-disulfide isomerase